MRLKYIIQNFGGIPTPFLFPEYISHVDVCGTSTPISAGFCKIRAEFGHLPGCPVISVKVMGGSVSLQLSARAEDADIIRRALEGE